MPRHSDSSVTRSSSTTSSATSPTGTVIAASPCQPSTMAPQSIEMTSPSASTRVARDAVHDLVVDRGTDRRRERRVAVALERRDAAVVADVGPPRWRRAPAVVTPGRTAARSSSRVSPTSSPATRIRSICSGVLISIPRSRNPMGLCRPSALRDDVEGVEDAGGHVVDLAHARRPRPGCRARGRPRSAARSARRRPPGGAG